MPGRGTIGLPPYDLLGDIVPEPLLPLRGDLKRMDMSELRSLMGEIGKIPERGLQ